MIKINHSVEIDNSDQSEIRQTESYIIFTVNGEEFGVEAKKVLEIIKYMPPLPMPNNFVDVCGMSVFRGKILPIIDLRKIFGLEGIAYDNKTVTIMVKSAVSDFGIIAERVLDINYIPVASIKTITAFNLGAKTKYLKSVANIEGRLTLLLDPEKMVEAKQNRSILKEPTPAEDPARLDGPGVYSKAEANSGDIDIQVDSPQPSSYLIDPKELEDLLKQAENKPEPKKIEAVLSELEREDQGENEVQSLSAETIEDILKRLEDEVRPGTNYSPDSGYRVLGINNAETTEDKSDD